MKESSLRERAIEILPGQYFDAETGLHQNWHRDYDPALGRYLQPDPRGLDDGPSIFGYVNQNPLNYTDPTGLARGAFDDAWGGGFCEGNAASCYFDAFLKREQKRITEAVSGIECGLRCEVTCVRDFIIWTAVSEVAESGAHYLAKQAAKETLRTALARSASVAGRVALVYKGTKLFTCLVNCSREGE